MSDKTEKSHKGGQVEPGQYPDLGETADYRDLNKLSPEQREKGYTTGKAVPDTKIETNDRDA